MKLMLDTHVWIWSQEVPAELGRECRRMILDDENELWVSSASVIEIARLLWLERLSFSKEVRHWIRDGVEALHATRLPVDDAIAVEAYQLPEPFHRDPADRLIVAAARITGCCILTADTLILSYPHVRSFDARR